VSGGAVQECGDVEARSQGRQPFLKLQSLMAGQAKEARGKEAIFSGSQVVEQGEVLKDESCVFQAPSAECGRGEGVEGVNGIGPKGAAF
jgi:hypothetical protein